MLTHQALQQLSHLLSKTLFLWTSGIIKSHKLPQTRSHPVSVSLVLRSQGICTITALHHRQAIKEYLNFDQKIIFPVLGTKLKLFLRFVNYQFWYRFLLPRPRWPWTHDIPALLIPNSWGYRSAATPSLDNFYQLNELKHILLSTLVITNKINLHFKH